MLSCPVKGPLRITQHFGQRPRYYARYDLAGHDGLDLTGSVAGVSVPVYAPFDGQLVHVDPKGAYGNAVIIHTPPDNTGKVRQIILGHLASFDVKAGNWIHLGER